MFIEGGLYMLQKNFSSLTLTSNRIAGMPEDISNFVNRLDKKCNLK